MSRVNIAVDLRSARSPVSSTKILAPALSGAERTRPLLEGLGGASSLPLLAGVMISGGTFLLGDL
ncbi:MAG: hypothetical protein OK442_04325 [Thaumarchaeota archaeon]|nr:hypothetical protein [Nitrososphaerota archaeon]